MEQLDSWRAIYGINCRRQEIFGWIQILLGLSFIINFNIRRKRKLYGNIDGTDIFSTLDVLISLTFDSVYDFSLLSLHTAIRTLFHGSWAYFFFTQCVDQFFVQLLFAPSPSAPSPKRSRIDPPRPPPDQAPAARRDGPWPNEAHESRPRGHDAPYHDRGLPPPPLDERRDMAARPSRPPPPIEEKLGYAKNERPMPDDRARQDNGYPVRAHVLRSLLSRRYSWGLQMKA